MAKGTVSSITIRRASNGTIVSHREDVQKSYGKGGGSYSDSKNVDTLFADGDEEKMHDHFKSLHSQLKESSSGY